MDDKERFTRLYNICCTIHDYCNRVNTCDYCPFEKVLDDGSGICKFRLDSDFAGWQLLDLFRNDLVNYDDGND